MTGEEEEVQGLRDNMKMVEHLGELRKHVIWVLIVFVVMFIVGLWMAKYAFEYLKSVPPAAEFNLHAFSPWSGVRVYMQFAFVIAVMITLPFFLYHLWAFVKPGLHKHEQEAAVKYIPFSVLMCIIGLIFSYFVVFKMALLFTMTVNKSMMLEETYGITEYFSFMLNILLPVSVLFELPIVVMFLTRIRLIAPQRLKKIRKYAYVGLVFVGTLVTPPDLISDLLVSIPLILLYELSVILSGVVYRKVQVNDRYWEN
jgi:sec-independent protein translocase protein TatC